MRTKNSIENQIKCQLESREIPVSENAWERLGAMMEENSSEQKSEKPTQKLWMPMSIAASVAVLIGLIWGWNFLGSEVPAEQQTVWVEKKEIEKNVEQPILNSNELKSAEKEELVENSQPNNSTERIKATLKPIREEVLVKTEEKELNFVPVETNHHLTEIKIDNKPQMELKTEPVMALNTDSLSKPKPKTNYVDPEMLLYSIENNQAVQEKNSGSRLVIIDFNK